MSSNVGLVEEDADSCSNSSNEDAYVPNRSSPPEPVHYVMYKRRWIGMFAICILNISTGLVWLTFNAVPQITSNWLHTGWTQTNLSVILYFIGSIVASTFSGYVFEKWGIKKALILGGLINIIGTWIRYFASFIESSDESNEARMAVVLTGQFIAATAQPFFLNAPPKYAAVWFSEGSRATATTIGSLSNPIAAAIAMVLIPIICTEENGDDMPFTLMVVGIFSIVAFLPTLITSTEPPTPPSGSAQLALAEAADEPFWISIKKTSSNKNFWVLFVAFSVYVAFFNAFSSLINQIVEPYGYTDDDGGIFAACLILSGIPGAAVSGAFVDKTKKYKLVMQVCAPCLALCYIGFIFVIRKDSFALICVVCAILGVFSFALLPVALELGIECTYPIPPSSSTSTLWMGGQLFAVIFLVVGDALRDDEGDPPKNMKTALITTAAVACLTSAISIFYNSPNHRHEAEQRKREEENRITTTSAPNSV